MRPVVQAIQEFKQKFITHTKVQNAHTDRRIPFRQTFILLLALVGVVNPVGAQLGKATLDGLCINVRSLYLSGDTRDMDGSLGMEFWGRKMTDDVQVAPVRVIRATDDTGAELGVRNTAGFHNGFSRWQTVALKHCSRSLKAIHLEGEAELLTPAVPYPIFTNLVAHFDGALRHPALAERGIELSCSRPEGGSPGDFEIQLIDPKGEFVGMSFQWADGSDASAFVSARGSFSFDGHKRTFAYRCMRPIPADLNLKVRVAGAMKSEKLPFKMSIRPPWVDPGELQASVTRVGVSKDPGADTSCYWTSLAFTGGPLTNVVGIRKLRITRAESDSGAGLELRQNDRWSLDSFARCGSSETGLGRTAVKLIPFHLKRASAAGIRVLEGEVELFKPAVANRGIVEITNLFNPGRAIEHPALQNGGVKITFLGRENFRAKTNEWTRTSQGWVSSGRYEGTLEGEDSLLFSIEDPEGKVISVESHKLEFFDESGGAVFPKVVTSSSESHLFTFGTIPKIVRARLHLATPESLQRFSFKVENIPLP